MGFEMLTVGKTRKALGSRDKIAINNFLLMYTVGSLMCTLHVSSHFPGIHLSSGARESRFWERKMPIRPQIKQCVCTDQ